MTSPAPLVDPLVERDLAVVLGASREGAAVVVEALAAGGVLGHGVVVIAAVRAARTGVELTAAVAALAAGDPPPTDMSDYELRTAAEEAAADLDDLWRKGPPAGEEAAAAWRRLNDRPIVTTERSATPYEVRGVPASSVHLAGPHGSPG